MTHYTESKEGDLLPVSPWAKEARDLYDDLRTTEKGLREEEAARRLAVWGPNELSKKGGSGALRVFMRQFASPLIFLLVGATVITIILGEVAETIVIALAIVVNTVLGFFQEYKAEQTLKKLVAYIKDICRVLRSLGEREVDSSMLVPGDVIRLSLGMRVPADGRLISVTNFSVDESVLTGESLSVAKTTDAVPEAAVLSERTNMVFAGSLVVEGYATALIVATGERTEIGRIASLVASTKSEPTPLQRSLSKLGWLIFFGVVGIVVIIFFLGISKGEPVLEMLLLSAAVAVGSIPEALPIALTVILTAGVSHIAKRRGIVRNLSAAETLGSTTVIMTDKTGTLTEARMQLTGILTAHDLLSGKPRPAFSPTDLSPDATAILTTALLCTDVAVENPSEPSDAWRLVGRPLEKNIAAAAVLAGIDIATVLAERKMSVLPFNSTNKFSVSFDRKEEAYLVLGAPDILVERSNLPLEERKLLSEHISAASSEGKRLIGVARIPREHHAHMKADALDPDMVKDLSFLGTIVLYDPLRPETRAAIEKIASYGARVVMVTGDLKGTAVAIARELGWELGESEVMTGSQIAELSDAALSRRLSTVRIFSRVTPEDKLRIGRLYQAQGEVVAMTGDGVNDAPSLKVADIGVALGSGSDVAKSVADLVLLDDNFETIVLAIEEGRRIIFNIRKAFTYLMVNCLDEVILVGGSLIVGLPMPLTALQIIWVNFFTGSLPALSFSFESEKRSGRTKSGEKQIFNMEVKVLTLGIGVLTSVLLFVLYWWLVSSGIDLGLARTVLFACFATYVLAIAFSFKSLHASILSYPLFDNKALTLSVLFAVLLVVCSMAVPFFREILGLVPLPLPWIGMVLLWLAFNILLVEGVKWSFRRFGHSRGKAR